MDKVFLSEALAGLLKLRDYDWQENADKLYVQIGICGNLKELVSGDAYMLVSHYSTSWEKYSGNVEYPVPDPLRRDPYCPGRNMWVGEYGALRYELLEHLIEEVRKDLLAKETEHEQG